MESAKSWWDELNIFTDSDPKDPKNPRRFKEKWNLPGRQFKDSPQFNRRCGNLSRQK